MFHRNNIIVGTADKFAESLDVDTLDETKPLGRWLKVFKKTIPSHVQQLVESTPNFDTVKFWRQYAIAVNDAMLIFCTSDARLPDIDHCTFSSKVKDFAIAYSFDVDQLGLPDLIKQHFELSVDVNSTIVPFMLFTSTSVL